MSSSMISARQQLLERGQELLGTGRLRGDEENRRDQIAVGVLAVLLVGVVAIALGVLYVRPPGYSEYRADMGNASGVRPGDQVRVAGITVGKVERIAVEGDRVRLTFTVKSSVRMGNETSIGVKMLTPVGGRFLQLAPRGGADLGRTVIPRDRVTGTYDMSYIVEQSTPKIEPLDGKTGRKIIESARKAVSGNEGALTELIDASVVFAEQMSSRTDQLRGALRVSDEYVAATAADRDMLFTLIHNVGQIGVGLGVRYDQVRRVFNLLGRLFVLLDRVGSFYQDGFEKAVDAGADLLSRLKPAADSVEGSLKSVDSALEQLRKVLGDQGVVVDQSGQTVRGVQVCVPNAAKRC